MNTRHTFHTALQPTAGGIYTPCPMLGIKHGAAAPEEHCLHKLKPSALIYVNLVIGRGVWILLDLQCNSQHPPLETLNGQ